MLRTRLWAGTLLALAAGAVLVADAEVSHDYPFLFVSVIGLGVLSTRELLPLLPGDSRPRPGVTLFGVLSVLVANWYATTGWQSAGGSDYLSAWEPVVFTFTAVVLLVFLVEMRTYRGPGAAVGRVANSVFVISYLGLLATFFVRIRFDTAESGLAMTATVFVPKCADIGAYLTGRLIGRRPFTPSLSPKKTWEGFAGGMVFAVGTALVISSLGPVFRHGTGHAVVFGLVVGLAGVLGDLAESMIKRDGLVKDAAKTIPGFGGVLDVIDSVLFAAPAAYALLRI